MGNKFDMPNTLLFFSQFVQIIDCGLMGKFMLIMDKFICLLFVFYLFFFLSEVILQLNSFST